MKVRKMVDYSKQIELGMQTPRYAVHVVSYLLGVVGWSANVWLWLIMWCKSSQRNFVEESRAWAINICTQELLSRLLAVLQSIN